jgi:mono/diheme cytochrome c family protein
MDRWLWPRLRLAGLAAAAVIAAGPAFAQQRGDPDRGFAYAEANCAECHETRAGHYDSPLIEAPPFEDIANDEVMTEMALYAFFRTPHPNMPNFIVPPADIDDLTSYLLTLRDRR